MKMSIKNDMENNHLIEKLQEIFKVWEGIDI